MDSTIGCSSLGTSQSGAARTQRGVHTASFAQLGAPVLAGPEGIRYDFNYGCRVQVPHDGWRVRMHDVDTGNIVFDAMVGVLVTQKTRSVINARKPSRLCR